MICKLFKWTLLTGAVLGGAGFLFFGTDLPSYLGTVAASVRDGVDEAIPVEFELKRAKGLIRQIDPQIDSCKLDVARSQVELEQLQEQVTNLQKQVEKEEKKLKAGARLLSGDGTAEYQLAGDRLARRRVEVDLARTKDSYVNNAAILRTKRALIDRQIQAVDAANQRLAAVRHERESLEDQIRSLETQQKQIETMAATSKRFDLDSSALSQAKEVIAKVQKRLNVTQKMIENEIVFHGDDTLVVEENRDVLKEIHELFAQQSIDGATATAVVEVK